MLRTLGVLMAAILIVAAIGSQASRFRIDARGPVSLVAQVTVVVPETPQLESAPGELLVSFDVQLDEGGQPGDPTSIPTMPADEEASAQVESTSGPEISESGETLEPAVALAVEANEDPAVPEDEEQPARPLVEEPDEVAASSMTNDDPESGEGERVEPEAADDQVRESVAGESIVVPDWWNPAPAVPDADPPAQDVPTDAPADVPDPTPAPDPIVLPSCPVGAMVWFSNLTIDRAADDISFRARVELPDDLPAGYEIEMVGLVTFAVQPSPWSNEERTAYGWIDVSMDGGVFSLPVDALNYLLDGLVGEVRVEVRSAVNSCDFAGSDTILVIDSSPPGPATGSGDVPVDTMVPESDSQPDVIYKVLDPN